MPSDDQHLRYAVDADLLREIGAALAAQDTRVRVRLPVDLARRAEAAWDRDEAEPLDEETPAETANRSRAGEVALIGLSVQRSGTRTDDEVEFELEATEVTAALRAHYEDEAAHSR